MGPGPAVAAPDGAPGGSGAAAGTASACTRIARPVQPTQLAVTAWPSPAAAAACMPACRPRLKRM